MRTLNDWLTAYGETHQNRINRKIHVICVPAILLSVLGLLYCIPKGPLPNGPNLEFLNWAHVMMALSLIFYGRLGLKPFNLMLNTFIAMSFVLTIAQVNGVALLPISAAIFVVAWIGQFYGHYIEGKKPSFFQDLQFLLIGPLWVYYH